jgi:hypothetical protein
MALLCNRKPLPLMHGVIVLVLFSLVWTTICYCASANIGYSMVRCKVVSIGVREKVTFASHYLRELPWFAFASIFIIDLSSVRVNVGAVVFLILFLEVVDFLFVAISSNRYSLLERLTDTRLVYKPDASTGQP